MKIAARFPIKTSRRYSFLIVGLHVFLMLLSIYYFAISVSLLLCFSAICLSFYYSWQHIKKVTQADDDLCWNGSHWIMITEQPKRILDLKLLPHSWLSNFACLLHFEHLSERYTWLFTRAALGERAYSELSYLVKQSILQAQQKAPK